MNTQTKIAGADVDMDAQRLIWAREDARSAKAARDAYHRGKGVVSDMPLDPSANPAASDLDWYQRRGE